MINIDYSRGITNIDGEIQEIGADIGFALICLYRRVVDKKIAESKDIAKNYLRGITETAINYAEKLEEN